MFFFPYSNPPIALRNLDLSLDKHFLPQDLKTEVLVIQIIKFSWPVKGKKDTRKKRRRKKDRLKLRKILYKLDKYLKKNIISSGNILDLVLLKKKRKDIITGTTLASGNNTQQTLKETHAREMEEKRDNLIARVFTG